MISLVTAHRICEHLDKYVYDKIWNEPYAEYRTHIVPQLLNKKDVNGNYVPVSGVFRGLSQIQLPLESDPKENKGFYIYSVPGSFFRYVQVNALSWKVVSEYNMEHTVGFMLHTTYGDVIWRKGIYIKQGEKDDCMLIAVDAVVFDKCTSKIRKHEGEPDYNPEALYNNPKDPTKVIFSKYFDADLVADDVITCQKLLGKQRVDPVPAGSIISFYAGRVLSGWYLSALSAGNYLESVADKDVLGITTVEVTAEGAPTYKYGEVDHDNRLLVHIPKIVNRKNLNITLNTCDIYVIPTRMKAGGNPPVAGFYLYTAGRGDKFIQLTHSDFAIDLDWLRWEANEHDFEEYYLYVVVRKHSQLKSITRDANYIDLLYSHTDEQIIKFLTKNEEFLNGRPVRSEMELWFAENLERSLYTDALQRRTNFIPPKDDLLNGEGNTFCEGQCAVCAFKSFCTLKNQREFVDGQPKDNATLHNAVDNDQKLTTYSCPYYSRRGIKDFIDILGYYNTLSLIAKRVTHFVCLPPTKKIVRVANGVRETSYVEDDTAISQFTVVVPIALDTMDIEDFRPVVYHNGVRIPHEYLSFAKTNSSTSKFTKEIMFSGSTRLEADPLSPEPIPIEVIQSVYCKHIRISVDLTRYTGRFHSNDKVVVELYDNLRDAKFSTNHPRGREIKKPTVLYIPTEDIEFLANKDYYLIENDVYVQQTVTPGESVTGGPWYEQVPSSGRPWTVQLKTEFFDVFEKVSGRYRRLDIPAENFDEQSLTVTIPQAYDTKTLILIEGPTTLENSRTFDIAETDFGILGDGIYSTSVGATDYIKLYPYDSEVLFLNNKRLIRDIDYHADDYTVGKQNGVQLPDSMIRKSRTVNTFTKANVYMQNVSYLQRTGNRLDAIRTNVTVISAYHGFLTANVITWPGEDPFWFDGLSTLTVEGMVCSDFTHSLGEVKINNVYKKDERGNTVKVYRNGAPYEIRTAASSKAIEILDDYKRQLDEDRLALLKRYFSINADIPIHRTIVPYSHKIYSVYLEEIINDYLHGDLNFSIMSDKTAFEAQFSASKYKNLKKKDVAYRHIADEHASDMMYVDIYPIYHRLRVADRSQYAAIAYLTKTLSPEDNIQHKDANNV